MTYRSSAGLPVLVVAAATALAACAGGGSSSPSVASLSTTTTSAASGGGSPGGSGGGQASTTAPKGDDATRLVDEWASCMRTHGDPNQPDPVIDVHGVINITIPLGIYASRNESNGVISVSIASGSTAACDRYLAAAETALRAANPVSDPQGPSEATQIKYVNCMRANGVPNYPYPHGDKSNFNGTGVDPNSPHVIQVNDLCGKRLGLPAWWINGWGPPGDVSVKSAGLNGNGPPAQPPTEPPSSTSVPGSNG
jgi:hypothetical protein